LEKLIFVKFEIIIILIILKTFLKNLNELLSNNWQSSFSAHNVRFLRRDRIREKLKNQAKKYARKELVFDNYKLKI